MAEHPTHLLWLDLETTGTDEQVDQIIEVGAILTDYELREIESYTCIRMQPEFNRFRHLMPRQVSEMHTANGLLKDVEKGKGQPLWKIERELIDILTLADALPGEVVLAGSGVAHFDRRFIAEQMPDLDEWLTYYCMDVGVMRRFLRDICGFNEEFFAHGDTKTHRAMDDIKVHLWEGRIMMHMLRLLSDAPVT